jgi:hypothetical protein
MNTSELTRAGLGEFGYNNVVLTGEFGPRQRFNSVVTDAELEPDPMIEEPICLRDKCRLCLEACVMDSISLRTDDGERDYRSLESDDHERIFIDTPRRRNLRDERGLTYAIEVGDYFRNLEGDVAEWLFSAAPEEVRRGFAKFKTPRFTRTVSQWLNRLIDLGFRIERLGEPRPTDEAVRTCPNIQDAQVVAYFLHVRARKPAAEGDTEAGPEERGDG